jgi:xylulokinase
MNDTQAVAIGTGTFRLGRGGLNVGTTSQVLAHVPFKRTDAENDIVSMPSPIAGLYAVLAENGLGASVLDHFLRQVVFARDALADHSGDGGVERVDAAVRATPPGSGGLLYLPWLAGSQAPAADPAVRGGFLNMSLDTTREHMLRAVLEGVAFSLKWLLPAVERFAEATFAELRFAGGGALSDEWSQILADIVGRPILQLDDARHVINRATAFLAFQRLDVLGLDAFDAFCPVKRTYEPRASNLDMYARLFEQFLAAFERNRPIFGALNREMRRV